MHYIISYGEKIGKKELNLPKERIWHSVNCLGGNKEKSSPKYMQSMIELINLASIHHRVLFPIHEITQMASTKFNKLTASPTST